MVAEASGKNPCLVAQKGDRLFGGAHKVRHIVKLKSSTRGQGTAMPLSRTVVVVA